jgi:hypothetical protein
MVVEDVRVLPQVSKRHGGECAQPPSNYLEASAYTHSPIMNLYISCPLQFLASSVNSPSVQIPTSESNMASKSQPEEARATM